MRFSTWFGALLGVSAGMSATAGPVVIPNEFVAGQTAVAADVNENFSALESAVNDNDARIANLESLGYTVIERISWIHGANISLDDLVSSGVAVAFSRPVRFEGLADFLNVRLFRLEQFSLPYDWVGIGQLVGGSVIQGAFNDYSFDADGRIVDWVPIQATPDDFVTGVYIQPLFLNQLGWYKLEIHGNFLIDETGRAVDVDFPGAELPSGDGREGGKFESWFLADQARDVVEGS
jgi:hypothetical protein